MRIKETAQDLLNHVPEQYQPAAVGMTAMAGLIVVFGGVHAIFNDDDENTAEAIEPSNTHLEATPLERALGNPAGMTMRFHGTKEKDACESAAEAMNAYGAAIDEPAFNDRDVVAACIEDADGYYELWLKNVPEM